MEFKLEDIEETFNGEIINKISNNEYLIKIQDKEYHLQILNINSRGMEFLLDNHFHSVNYIENQTAEMKIVVDGVPLTVNMHTKLDEIVYRNTGGADTGSTQINLRSQIPGKVVSIEVKVGDKVKNGDVVCVFFFSSRRRHTRLRRDWSSDVCSSDLLYNIINFTMLS